MNILLVSATTFEILPLLDYLKANFKSKDGIRFFNKKIDIRVLVTGVGAVHTSFHTATFLSKIPTDLAINLGIAGALDNTLNIGDTIQVTADQMADIGVENADGSFTTIFEMELQAQDEKPYTNGKIMLSDESPSQFLQQVEAITVNKVHGTTESIAQIKKKYPHAAVESMEGAAFAFSCQMNQVNYLQIRSISNYVEPRNKANWNIPLAIENLNSVAIDLIKTLLED